MTVRDKRRNVLYNFLDQAVEFFQQKNNGLAPSRRQLYDAALSLKKLVGKRLKIQYKDVTNYYLQGGPDAFVQFSTPRKIKPKYFQTLPVIKLGMWHIDYAEYRKSYANDNDGNNGFILAVENFTNKLFVYPCSGTSASVWISAIKQLVNQFPTINSFYSDPDPVATSPKFIKLINEKYQIRWFYLRKNVKSFLAERYIGLVKQRLSMTLAINSLASNNIITRWIDYVKPLVKAYNNEVIPNTKFRRIDVNYKNFDTFLRQLTGVKNPEMENYFSYAGPFNNKKWNKLIFKFDLGQKVFIHPEANYHLIKGKRFNWKRSIKGNFDTKQFTISGRQLRRSRMKKNTLVPVYSLLEFDRLFSVPIPARNEAEQKKHNLRKKTIKKRLNFYENELIAVPNRLHQKNK